MRLVLCPAEISLVVRLCTDRSAAELSSRNCRHHSMSEAVACSFVMFAAQLGHSLEVGDALLDCQA
jgi:hypothetical protein